MVKWYEVAKMGRQQQNVLNLQNNIGTLNSSIFSACSWAKTQRGLPCCVLKLLTLKTCKTSCWLGLMALELHSGFDSFMQMLGTEMDPRVFCNEDSCNEGPEPKGHHIAVILPLPRGRMSSDLLLAPAEASLFLLYSIAQFEYITKAFAHLDMRITTFCIASIPSARRISVKPHIWGSVLSLLPGIFNLFLNTLLNCGQPQPVMGWAVAAWMSPNAGSGAFSSCRQNQVLVLKCVISVLAKTFVFNLNLLEGRKEPESKPRLKKKINK